MSATRGLAFIAKPSMKCRTQPKVPKNARTSVTVLHGGQSLIRCTRSSSGALPSAVQRCPSTIARGAHNTNFFAENVPPYFFIRCRIRLTACRCSHTNRLMPLLPGIVS